MALCVLLDFAFWGVVSWETNRFGELRRAVRFGAVVSGVSAVLLLG